MFKKVKNTNLFRKYMNKNNENDTFYNYNRVTFDDGYRDNYKNKNNNKKEKNKTNNVKNNIFSRKDKENMNKNNNNFNMKSQQNLKSAFNNNGNLNFEIDNYHTNYNKKAKNLTKNNNNNTNNQNDLKLINELRNELEEVKTNYIELEQKVKFYKFINKHYYFYIYSMTKKCENASIPKQNMKIYFLNMKQ
jgi:hypothetical protein